MHREPTCFWFFPLDQLKTGISSTQRIAPSEKARGFWETSARHKWDMASSTDVPEKWPIVHPAANYHHVSLSVNFVWAFFTEISSRGKARSRRNTIRRGIASILRVWIDCELSGGKRFVGSVYFPGTYLGRYEWDHFSAHPRPQITEKVHLRGFARLPISCFLKKSRYKLLNIDWMTKRSDRQIPDRGRLSFTVRNLIGAGNLIGAAGFAEKVGDRVKNHR
jgi:hypothetical protein